MANVKLFVDFWNFQLSWNQNIKPPLDSSDTFVRIAWRDLASVLMAELPAVIGTTTPISYKGTNVYASVNPKPGSKDEGLKRFLHGVLGQMTGFNVNVVDRKSKTDECPHCDKEIERQIEKGVDVSIVTDLFEGAVNDSYNIAVLLTSDSDFVPAISTIQERMNRQIIHVGFRRGSDQMRTVAWGHIVLDGDVAKKLSE